MMSMYMGLSGVPTVPTIANAASPPATRIGPSSASRTLPADAPYHLRIASRPRTSGAPIGSSTDASSA